VVTCRRIVRRSKHVSRMNHNNCVSVVIRTRPRAAFAEEDSTIVGFGSYTVHVQREQSLVRFWVHRVGCIASHRITAGVRARRTHPPSSLVPTLSCRVVDCPYATPCRCRSDRRSTPRPIPVGARALPSVRLVGSHTRSSGDRRRASVSQGQRFGCRPRPAGSHPSVHCSAAAPDHSGGWPARGLNTALARIGSTGPTRPGFDRGGKGSNPARRDHLKRSGGPTGKNEIPARLT
jgi:hypothetical protein